MTRAAETLRQLLALLESERQALAGLDLERIMVCADCKERLCLALERFDPASLDEESRGLLDAVSRLNRINRQLRNLIAAGVHSRLGALTGAVRLYGSAGV